MDLIIGIVIINSILSIIFYFNSILYIKDKTKAFLLTVFFLLCPVIGFSCIMLSNLFYHFRRVKSIEISGIHFSDDKIRYQYKEDYATEVDVAPLEEVLLVSGVKDKRQRLLDSIKSDINASMATYSAAIFNDDSEVSHYAAAMLLKTKDSFDRSLNRLAQQYDLDRSDIQVNLEYISAEDGYLTCGIQLFKEERVRHLYSYTALCENLYKHHPEFMTEEHFTKLLNYFIELGEHAKAMDWIEIFEKAYPLSENVFSCKLKYYFVNKNRSKFFEVLNQLKSSGIPISSDIIDLIRFFNKRVF